MTCSKCSQENEEGAVFCKNCGAVLSKEKSLIIDSADLLLVVWGIMRIVSWVSNTLFNEFGFGSLGIIVYILISILCLASYLLPTGIIKERRIRITAIVLVAIPVIYYCFKLSKILCNYLFN